MLRPSPRSRAWLTPTYSARSTIDAESDSPFTCATCRSSRCKLRAPVRDDRAAEEVLRPRVHLAGDALGRRHEDIGALVRQAQVALVVERHAVDLPERILAVEHPAVGAGEQGVGDVADALLRAGARTRRGTGTLDPLPLQVVRDRAALG